MGNRTIITTMERKIQVYVHWNGGKASIKAFLDYCNAQKYRFPEADDYGWARLCQVIGNFFGSTTSVGVGLYTDGSEADCDNGTYIIEKWKIVGRENAPSQEEWYLEKYAGVMREVNAMMPEKDRLSSEELEKVIEQGWKEEIKEE